MGMHHAVGPPQSDDQNILNGAGYANQNAGYVGQQQQLPVGYPNQNAPGPQGYGGQQQQQQQPTPPAGYQQPPQQPGYPPPQSSPSAYLPPQASPYGLPPSASPFPPPAGQQNQYGPPPQQQSPYGTGDVGSLSQAMSQVDLSGQQPGTISKASRKKGRAYHQLDQAPEQAGLGAGNNFPPFTPNVGDNMQQGFLDADPSSMAMGPQPHTGSQFPMPGAPAFAPQQQVDPTAFHARMGGPAKGMPAMGGKIDPLAIPSIPVSRDMALQHYRKTMFPTLARQLPPNATSDFIAQDQGNASPRVCRLTLNAVPVSGELLATTHLPLALLIQPLAKLKPEEVPIPVLDFGESGPPRCRRCRTYMNPFMQFVHGGGKFRCNMCLFPNNEVPNEYYSPVDMAGVRVDRDQRPELTRGTVEFVVPKEYWAKKGSAEAIGDGKGGAPMRWLFLIDVTETAVNRGTLEAVVGGIKEALYGASAYENILPGEEEQDGREGMKRRLPAGCKVGICTLDKEVHFYNLSVSSFFKKWWSWLTKGDMNYSPIWIRHKWW
jgi:protein transport protein SEC24